LKQQLHAVTASSHTELIEFDLRGVLEQIRGQFDRLKLDFDTRIQELRVVTSRRDEVLVLEIATKRARRERLLRMQKENADMRGRLADLERRLRDKQALLMNQSQQTVNISGYKSQLTSMLAGEKNLATSQAKLLGEVVIYRDILEAKARFEEGHHQVQQVTHVVETPAHREKIHHFQDQRSGTHRGQVEIRIADQDGRYVSLRNECNHDVGLGGWLIKQWSGSSTHSSATVQFEIPVGVYISPGKTLQIWSNNEGEIDDLPHQIVAKNVAIWCRGSSTTHLYDDHDRSSNPQATYNSSHASQDQAIMMR